MGLSLASPSAVTVLRQQQRPPPDVSGIVSP
jgi:hypothetical protein